MFLITDQLKKAIRTVEKTIKQNGWLIITGEVGTGKTTLRRYLSEEWAKENGITIISATAWKNNGKSRAPVLMKRIIQALDPDAHVPGDVELREERLKTHLLRVQYKHRKKGEKFSSPVLFIDSAQDANDATFRELKKLREIHHEPLFSIVMFGNESATIDNVLKGREVGYRCRQVELELLDRDEILEFAEKRFDLSFPSGRDGAAARELFIETVHPSGLGIEYFAGCLSEFASFNGTVTTDLIRQATLLDLRYRMKKARVLVSDITREAKENGMRLTTTEVASILSGKSKVPQSKISEIQNLTEKVLRRSGSE